MLMRRLFQASSAIMQLLDSASISRKIRLAIYLRFGALSNIAVAGG